MTDRATPPSEQSGPDQRIPSAGQAPGAGGPAPDHVPTVDELNEMSKGSIHDAMGIVVTEATPERVAGTMPVIGNTQPYGRLHGGASVVLAESLGSLFGGIIAGPGRGAVGVDINATHHRAAHSGTVTGVATILHAGRRTASFNITVSDEEQRPVCTARLTVMFIDDPLS